MPSVKDCFNFIYYYTYSVYTLVHYYTHRYFMFKIMSGMMDRFNRYNDFTLLQWPSIARVKDHILELFTHAI